VAVSFSFFLFKPKHKRMAAVFGGYVVHFVRCFESFDVSKIARGSNLTQLFKMGERKFRIGGRN